MSFVECKAFERSFRRCKRGGQRRQAERADVRLPTRRAGATPCPAVRHGACACLAAFPPSPPPSSLSPSPPPPAASPRRRRRPSRRPAAGAARADPARQRPRFRGAGRQPAARRRARADARSGTPASAAARSASSTRRPARCARCRSAKARRRTASSRDRTAPPGSPTAGSTPSSGSIPRTDQVRAWPLPAEFPDSTSTPPPSTARTDLVHRPDRRLRAARSAQRRDAGLARSRRSRPLRDRRHAVGRDLLCLARRQPPRPGGSRDRRSDDHRAADRGPGRAAGVGRPKRQSLGLGVERRPAQPLRSGDRGMAQLAPRGRAAAVYAVYVDDRDIVWISDFGANAVLSFDPATERWTRYPGSGGNANVRQILGAPRLDLSPRIGPRPDHGRPHRARPVKRSVGVSLSWGAACAAPAARQPSSPPRRPRSWRWASASTAAAACVAMPSSPAATRRRDRRSTTSPGGRSPPNRASITRPPCAGWPSTMGAGARCCSTTSSPIRPWSPPGPRWASGPRGRGRTARGDSLARGAAPGTEFPQALAPAAARRIGPFVPLPAPYPPPCTSPHMGEVWRFPIRRGAASSSRAAAADEGDDHAR